MLRIITNKKAYNKNTYYISDTTFWSQRWDYTEYHKTPAILEALIQMDISLLTKNTSNIVIILPIYSY